MTKGNSPQRSEFQAQNWEDSSHKLEWVREAARKDRRLRFHSLLHHLTPHLLLDCFGNLRKDAASGVDEVTWEEYQDGVEARLLDLHDRVHSGRYRARPSKRIYVAKDDGRQRPIGIATVEDKIVQAAVVRILSAIYEEDFLGFSYGFRPGRSPHRALDAIWVGIVRNRINWVLDADVRSFFDRIDHAWLEKMVEHRVADPRMLRLIRKWLRAGVSEDGQWSKTTVGTPQGAVASPLLANIFLHYALDLWAQKWREEPGRGDVIIVRYADDFVIGFQHRAEAERFLEELKERMAKFKLELHEGKTRLIEFGRYARSNRRRRGMKGEPETFVFLGFVHACAQSKDGKGFSIRRKPVAKRLARKLAEIKTTLMKRRHDPIPEQGAWLRSVVLGVYNYYAVPGTRPTLNVFRSQVNRSWLRALRRRSQKGRKLTWKRMEKLLDTWVPKTRCVHPPPNLRLTLDPR